MVSTNLCFSPCTAQAGVEGGARAVLRTHGYMCKQPTTAGYRVRCPVSADRCSCEVLPVVSRAGEGDVLVASQVDDKVTLLEVDSGGERRGKDRICTERTCLQT